MSNTDSTDKIQHGSRHAPQMTTLSERLVYALDTLKITQAELARRINVKPQAIHYLCSSRAKKSGFTHEIANVLQISSRWLAFGDGAMNSHHEPKAPPVHSRAQVVVLGHKELKLIAASRQNIQTARENASEWILTNSDATHGFAFKLHDKSMFPRFDQETIIIINPDRIPKNNDYVAIYHATTDDVIFRKYIEKNNVIFLFPDNTEMYKALEKSVNDVILGVMTEARWLN